jgi:hypothetical protein
MLSPALGAPFANATGGDDSVGPSERIRTARSCIPPGAFAGFGSNSGWTLADATVNERGEAPSGGERTN